MSLELYPMKFNGVPLIYAPVLRKVALCNESALTLLERHGSGEVSPDDPLLTGLLDSLEATREEALTPPSFNAVDLEAPWRPTEATISITGRCTLRCIYCYANGGEQPSDMSWETAKAVIDMIVRNSLDAGKEKVSLHFHGEGEPTANMPLFSRCIEYFREATSNAKLRSSVSMSSNCFYTSAQREYVLKNVDSVSVSFDGSPSLQDKQRPRPGGGGSSEKVLETLREFDGAGFNYAIRATVLPESFGEGMLDAVRWLAANVGCREVRFEPVQPQGRGARYGGELRSREFLEGFRKAKHLAANHSINLDYSVCDSSSVKNTFCGAMGGELNFLVLADGTVTTCNDVLKKNHEKAEIFHVGAVDPDSGELRLDTDKVRWLRSRSVKDFKGCEGCYARWHCGGDCFARKPGKIDRADPCALNEFRCTINRELVMDDVLLLAMKSDREALLSALERRVANGEDE